MAKESFIFYASFDEALKELPDKSRLKIYDAICDYALRGKEPDFSGVEKAVFSLIKPQIKANLQRYENGKKGGAPKNNQNAAKEKRENNQNSTEEQPKNNQKQANENVNVNVNENVNVNNHSPGACVRVESDEPMTCAEFLAKYPNIYPDTNVAAYGLDWDMLDEKFQDSKNYLQGEPHDLSWVKNNYRRIIGDAYKDKGPTSDMGYNGMAFFDAITANLQAREGKTNDG